MELARRGRPQSKPLHHRRDQSGVPPARELAKASFRTARACAALLGGPLVVRANKEGAQSCCALLFIAPAARSLGRAERPQGTLACQPACVARSRLPSVAQHGNAALANLVIGTCVLAHEDSGRTRVSWGGRQVQPQPEVDRPLGPGFAHAVDEAEVGREISCWARAARATVVCSPGNCVLPASASFCRPAEDTGAGLPPWACVPVVGFAECGEPPLLDHDAFASVPPARGTKD